MHHETFRLLASGNCRDPYADSHSPIGTRQAYPNQLPGPERQVHRPSGIRQQVICGLPVFICAAAARKLLHFPEKPPQS